MSATEDPRPTTTTPSTAPDAARETVVVVGAGLTAATAVETLRTDGFAGRVVVVGEEPDRPYERPPLSKGLLLGTADRDSVYVHPASWYADHDVELRLGTRVTAIDRAARTVTLADGDRLGYTHLLLATGSRPRTLQVAGADLTGVLTLRTLPDADRLVQALSARPRVVVIGGGWIGLETTAAAREAGCPVTVLEAGPLPLLRVLGPQVAGVFADLHRQHGVDLRTGVTVTALCSEDGTRVSGVQLADGDVVPADLVVVGIGIVANDELARDAGLEVDSGVVVDEHLRSSDPHIWAAGDVARALHPALGRHLRVEHWANAVRHGVVAGRSLLGADAVDERPPYFYTDQYDLGMEYVGFTDPTAPDGELVVRGDLATRTFLAFWLQDGRVVAGMNVNIWDVSESIEALIRSGRTVDVARLTDPDVPLTDV
jgi:3-phenylpropionate/trans-cinnamate dioxygenase ferredoxin reductase subunit